MYNEYIRKESYIMEQGTIFKFHNDLDTDQIIASQYLLLPNLDEMKDIPLNLWIRILQRR